jgi:hypothetical protein
MRCSRRPDSNPEITCLPRGHFLARVIYDRAALPQRRRSLAESNQRLGCVQKWP